MNLGLDGKNVVVTGASRGIGREVACAFTAEGSRVAAVGRTSVDLDETVRLAEARGGKAVAWTCDVTDPGQVDAFVDTVASTFGSIDVLVNNAGQRQNFSRIEKLSVEEWSRVIDANLTSAFVVSRAVARCMLPRRAGAVVNIASTAGPAAFARIGAYCAAKAGVIALTKVMAVEWAEHGVRVNAVAPGWIESPMNVELRTEPRNRDAFKAIESQIPLGAFGAPSDVAAAVLFLSGQTSPHVTGATYFVDGGSTAS